MHNGSSIKIPYNSFPHISQTFIDEVFIRTHLCLNSIEIITRNKVERSIKSQFHKLEFIDYVMVRFSIMEFQVLFDGNSNLSLSLHKNKKKNNLILQRAKLRKIFPTLQNDKFSILYNRIQDTLYKNKELMYQLEWTRNNKLAHASISWFDKNIMEINSRKFPLEQFRKLIEDFQNILIDICFLDIE